MDARVTTSASHQTWHAGGCGPGHMSCAAAALAACQGKADVTAGETMQDVWSEPGK